MFRHYASRHYAIVIIAAAATITPSMPIMIRRLLAADTDIGISLILLLISFLPRPADRLDAATPLMIELLMLMPLRLLRRLLSWMPLIPEYLPADYWPLRH